MKSNNIEIMINDKADGIIEEPLKSFLPKYKIGLETLMKGSSFIFDHVDILYYKFHKINLNRRGSYIDLPDWTKNRKATINTENNVGNAFNMLQLLGRNKLFFRKK